MMASNFDEMKISLTFYDIQYPPDLSPFFVQDYYYPSQYAEEGPYIPLEDVRRSTVSWNLVAALVRTWLKWDP